MNFKHFFLNELNNAEDAKSLLEDKLEFFQEKEGPWADLQKAIGFSQNKHHGEDLFTHLATAYKYGLSYTQDPLFAMICLFHDIGKVECCRFDESRQDFTFHKHEYIGAVAVYKWLKENDFNQYEANRIKLAIQHHQYRIYPDTKDKTIKSWLQDIGIQAWEDIRILRLVDRMANKANDRKPIIYQLYIETDNRINEIAQSLWE